MGECKRCEETEKMMLACKENVEKVEDEIETMEQKMGTISSELQLLRNDISQIKIDIEEILDIFSASKGFVKVLGWIGKGIRWLFGIAALFGLGYMATKK